MLVFRGANNYQILQWGVLFLCFKLQFHRHQKQIYSFCKTAYNRNNVHLTFPCVFGALSDVNKCKISFLPQPWWPTITQVPYMLTSSPPLPPTKQTFLQHCKLVKKEKKYSKASFAPINGYYFPSFMFIFLRFKRHQTLYISVSLAQSDIFAIIFDVSEICLVIFNVSSTLRDDTMQHYFERWFICCASLRDTGVKYWIEYLGVPLDSKSWNC